MFQILYGDQIIGSSLLEQGDPPMGCAHGKLIPSPEYSRFRVSGLHENDEDPDMRRWVGLNAKLSDGTSIVCIGVSVHDFAPPYDMDPLVDVIGISHPSYEELFPGRRAAYERHLEQSRLK